MEVPDETRIESAREWLLARAGETCGADALGKLESLPLTLGRLRAIECARAAVSAVETARAAEAARSGRLRSNAEEVGNAIRVDTAASSGEPHPLASACAALGLGEDCGAGARVDALSGLATSLASARAAAALARARHADAVSDVRIAAREYAAAARGAETMREGVRKRQSEGRRDWESVVVLDAKGAQYDGAAAEAKLQVRQTGVDSSCTHDAVATLAKKVRSIKREIDAHKADAERYLELPPDLTMAGRKIDEVRNQIQKAEDDIRNALHGFMD